MTNDYFMRVLESISVISDDGQASLSISHSGGDYFMKKLKTIEVQGAERTEFDLSASNHGGQKGDYFMKSLETISVVSTADHANLSISHSGGSYFMK